MGVEKPILAVDIYFSAVYIDLNTKNYTSMERKFIPLHEELTTLFYIKPLPFGKAFCSNVGNFCMKAKFSSLLAFFILITFLNI